MTKILDQRMGPSGKIEYKVDWVGNYEPTWEPAECLLVEHAQDVVSAYKARSGPTSGKRAGGGKRGRGRR